MSFFQRLYDVLPAYGWIAATFALGAIALLFGYERAAARREDRDDLARWEPVTDRRADELPAVNWPPAEELPGGRVPVDQKAIKRAIATVKAPKRLNRHKAKVRRKK